MPDMSLPPILARKIEAAPSLPSDFPDLYVTEMRCHFPHGASWSMRATVVPYHHASDTVMPGTRPKTIDCQNLRAKAAQYPHTVGMAMGTFLSLLGPLMHERDIQNEISAAAPGADLTALEAELAAVQAVLRGE